MRALLALIILLLAGAPLAAQAHTRSESNSVWEVGGDNVDLIITFPEAEVKPLIKNGRAPTDGEMAAYLAAREYPIIGGKRCPLSPPVETLSATPGYRKYDLTFDCKGLTGHAQIHSSAFADVTPSHTNFAQIQDTKTGDFTEQLITRDRATIDVSGSGGELAEAHFIEFIRMGIMHIFTGVDHMSFLLGLVLISRRLKDLVFVVTGFTIGHSLTLALAVTGVIRPHPEFIDALVALTIALIGAENVGVATGKPKLVALLTAGFLLGMFALKLMGIGTLPALLIFGAAMFAGNYLLMSGSLPNAGRLRMVITVVFGLVHGFGFAANLLEMQLPPGRIAELLVGFNLGVEIGQMTLVLGVTLLVYLLSKVKLTVPRPVVVESSSALLVGLGTFWLVTRSF